MATQVLKQNFRAAVSVTYKASVNVAVASSVRSAKQEISPKFGRYFLLQRYIYHKIVIKTQSVSQKYESTCGKMPHFTMLKNPSKTFLDPDPDEDALKNTISSPLSTDTSLW